MFKRGRYAPPRPLGLLAVSSPEQTISCPAWGPMRFGPLDPTPSRDSRYTLS